ncbi:MAG: peptidase C15 [Stenomitos rutilans HA7619-LM2]|jgi:pyroglutamyl-peptidase|nr:peptidase C15 [Stenomitos rutilans HA7619-LM2]
MTTRLLLTSFDIWKPHHRSNASDDLLNVLLEQNLLASLAAEITLLRKLPVDFQLAPQHVTAQIETLQPDVVICCGMAERRSHLTVEANGKHQATVLRTTVDVDRLVEGLAMTHVSHDAGAFVCNALYYSVLQYIADRSLACQCLFVHVPILNAVNHRLIVKDFLAILQWL